MKSKQKEPELGFFERHSARVAACSVVLIMLVSALIRLRLLGVPLERDEGEYAYAGQLILKGFPPYLHVYNMKFPGTYAAYACIMALFGQTPSGIHTGLLLVNAATILLVFALARKLLGDHAAIASALTFAVLSLGQGVLGVFAHATHFVAVFAVAGALALLAATSSNRRWLLVLSGMLFGMAVLMKQHGAFLVAFGVIYVVWAETRTRPASRSRLIGTLAAFGLGVLAPLAVTFVALACTGVIGRFWFWTFKYAATYVSQTPIVEVPGVFASNVATVAAASVWLWVVVGAGALLLWKTEAARPRRVFIGGFTVASFLSVCPGLYFRQHYFVLLLPAAALLAGVAVSWGRAKLTRRMKAVPILVVLLAAAVTILIQREFLFQMSPREACRSVYGQNPFPESLEVADYIKANSDEADRIAVIGSEPQVYFYANRLSATGHIYMYGLMEPQKYALEMQQELIREVEAARPRFLVFVPGNSSWLRRPTSHKEIFDWALRYTRERFDLVGLVEILSDGAARYYWDADSASAPPAITPAMMVYRRRTGGEQ